MVKLSYCGISVHGLTRQVLLLLLTRLIITRDTDVISVSVPNSTIYQLLGGMSEHTVFLSGGKYLSMILHRLPGRLEIWGCKLNQCDFSASESPV